MRVSMVNKIKNGIIWIRTPKCATSTVAIHLENFCKWKGMRYTPSTEHNSMAPNKYANLGHLWGGNVNWDVIHREDRAVIGSIRNPLDRFISHYKHHVKLKKYISYEDDVSSFYLENYHNTHFENFFKGLDNYLCKYLGIGDDKGWDKQLLDDRYDLIFASEYIPQGLDKFEKFTGYTFENKDLKENVNSDKKQIITHEFLELFRQNNRNDYELYNYVVEKYGYR